MSEMVERVARAIYDAAERHDEYEIDRVAWERTTENNRVRSRQLARAAIEAMREPTAAMKAAGAKRIPEAGYDLAHDAYVTMLDASLHEGEAGR